MVSEKHALFTLDRQMNKHLDSEAVDTSPDSQRFSTEDPEVFWGYMKGNCEPLSKRAKFLNPCKMGQALHKIGLAP